MVEATQVEIKDVSEALRWLNLLVERGKNIDAAIAFVEPKEPGLLASAMVKGAKAVLERKVKLDGDFGHEETANNRDVAFHDGTDWAFDEFMVTLAQAYAPTMVELGWVPK